MWTKLKLYWIALHVRKRLERHFQSQTLANVCAVASGEIWKELTKRDLKAKIHAYTNGTSSHCFVVAEGYLIDVTATQFGNYPKVVVKPFNVVRNKIWKVVRTYNNVHELREAQVRNGWRDEQLAWI